jgi:hypothetical protein
LASDRGDRCPFLFGRHLGINLLPFPLTPAQLLVFNLSISAGAAKCLTHRFFENFLCLQHHTMTVYVRDVVFYFQISGTANQQEF